MNNWPVFRMSLQHLLPRVSIISKHKETSSMWTWSFHHWNSLLPCTVTATQDRPSSEDESSLKASTFGSILRKLIQGENGYDSFPRPALPGRIKRDAIMGYGKAAHGVFLRGHRGALPSHLQQFRKPRHASTWWTVWRAAVEWLWIVAASCVSAVSCSCSACRVNSAAKIGGGCRPLSVSNLRAAARSLLNGLPR